MERDWGGRDAEPNPHLSQVQGRENTWGKKPGNWGMSHLEAWQWPGEKLQSGLLKLKPSWEWWGRKHASHLKQASESWFLKSKHIITVSLGYILVLNNPEIHSSREKKNGQFGKQKEKDLTLVLCYFVFLNQVISKYFWLLHFTLPRSLQNCSFAQRTHRFQLYEAKQ